jgi:4,5-DOPA dioxygenase extradiol
MPEAVLVVSDHWVAAPLTVSATAMVPLFYDFYGFPRLYYEVEYAAPHASELAVSLEKLTILHGDARRVFVKLAPHSGGYVV